MAGSTIPRRALGRILKNLRLEAGKGQLAAGLKIEVSPQVISRMEEGIPVRVCTSQFRDLLVLYGAGEEETAQVIDLIQEIRATKGDPRGGWWRAYSDLVASHFDHYMSLEDACNRLTTFQIVLLPGLLQTPTYRRSMIVTADPEMSAVNVERRVELATRRQSRVTQDDEFSMDVLLSEAVLRHQVGSKAVMADQLRHLAALSELPNISIRVVPFNVGSHLGLVVQTFVLFEFPDLEQSGLKEPPAVFVEGFEGALFLEDDRMIEKYRGAVTALRSVALDENSTRQTVLDLAKEYST